MNILVILVTSLCLVVAFSFVISTGILMLNSHRKYLSAQIRTAQKNNSVQMNNFETNTMKQLDRMELANRELLHYVNSIEKNVQLLRTEQSIGQMIRSSTSMGMPQLISNNLIPNNPVFRSIDGKYKAGSLEELVEKMMEDPGTNITSSDLDSLRKVFEQISTSISFESFDDTDEEDGPGDVWRKPS